MIYIPVSFLCLHAGCLVLACFSAAEDLGGARLRSFGPGAADHQYFMMYYFLVRTSSDRNLEAFLYSLMGTGLSAAFDQKSRTFYRSSEFPRPAMKQRCSYIYTKFGDLHEVHSASATRPQNPLSSTLFRRSVELLGVHRIRYYQNRHDLSYSDHMAYGGAVEPSGVPRSFGLPVAQTV